MKRIDYSNGDIVGDNGVIFIKELDPKISKNGNKCRIAMFKCGKCNNKFTTNITNVRSNHTKSCGCAKAIFKNEYEKRLSRIFKNMRERCYDSRHPSYNRYKDKGICDEWMNNIFSFIKWAIDNDYIEHFNKYGSKDTTIDRIDSNKGYYPNNCRWSTRREQELNKDIRGNTPYRGVGLHKTYNKYYARVRLKCGRLKHIGVFINAIDAAKAYDNYVIDNKLDNKLNFGR